MPTIKVYSTPSCVYCQMLKSYLTDKKVVFQNIDVSADQAAAEEMVAKSGQMGVPVAIVTTDIGAEEVVVGFDKERINKLMNIK